MAAGTAACFASAASAKPAEAADEWRGVHVMAWGPSGGTSGLDVLKRAIDKVLLPLRVNVMIYEVDYNFEFESDPAMRFGEVLTKKAARELAEFCHSRGIRLIPQFNCLGHQSWARQNMIFPLMAWHPEMEEIPDVPFAERPKLLKSWCPLHPGVNPIVFGLLDEIMEAFQADAMHVGMDEVLIIASPKCPRCSGKSPAKLFAKVVNDLHGHIVGRHGRTMLMWGDRLLDASQDNMGKQWEASDKGTAPAIDLVPKDIVICDWHYSLFEDYPSIRLFLEKGFRVWPASWKNTKAALALLENAYRNKTERMLGYFGTSWVLRPGYFAQALLNEGDPKVLKDRAQPAADTLKACMNWLKERSG